MASRTKQKEEARARRLAEEQARAERARRQRRMQMVGGIVVGAVIVVVALILLSSGGGGNKETGLQTGTQKNNTINVVNQMLAGISQSGNRLGNANAPVTMTYYGDYECPVCKDFTDGGGFPKLVANDIRSGKVKVLYKSFCTATCNGPGLSVFNTQQVAGLAAGKQNLFWQYTELFYREQGAEGSGYVNEAYLTGLAQQIPGLNLSAWQTARNDPNLLTQVNSDQNSAKQIGVSGTPTLIFSGPKGQAAASQAVPTYAQLESVIKQVS